MFKKYKGTDKYHFRVYKRSIGHPFIVVVVKEEELNGELFIDGYMITHSLDRVMDKPKAYERLRVNPNPNDNRPSFVNKFKIANLPANEFSKPYSNWHLCKEDEMLIDRLEKRKKE